MVAKVHDYNESREDTRYDKQLSPLKIAQLISENPNNRNSPRSREYYAYVENLIKTYWLRQDVIVGESTRKIKELYPESFGIDINTEEVINAWYEEYGHLNEQSPMQEHTEAFENFEWMIERIPSRTYKDKTVNYSYLQGMWYLDLPNDVANNVEFHNFRETSIAKFETSPPLIIKYINHQNKEIMIETIKESLRPAKKPGWLYVLSRTEHQNEWMAQPRYHYTMWHIDTRRIQQIIEVNL